LSAICSQYPDYAVILISAIEGVTQTTKQHFHLALTLKLPIIILVTKVDLVEEEKFLHTRDSIKVFLKSPSISRLNFVVKTKEDVTIAAKSFDENIVPILLISNKTGSGLDLLKQLLHSLPPHNEWQTMINDKAEFHITSTDIVKNEPPVLLGVVYKGTIKLKQRMQIGPTNGGKFL